MAPTFSPLAFARRHTSTMSALSPWIVIAGAGFDLAIGSSPVLWEIRNEWSVATKTRLGLGSSELVSSRMALDPLAIRRSFYVFVRRSPARRLDQSQVTSKKCEANYRTTYPSSFAAEDWRGRSAPCTGFLPAATRDTGSTPTGRSFTICAVLAQTGMQSTLHRHHNSARTYAIVLSDRPKKGPSHY